MQLTLETEEETDGRWLAEVPELAGVMAYGETRNGAMGQGGGSRVSRARRTPGARRGSADADKLLYRGGMSRFAAAKARRVLDALKRIGWRVKRRTSPATRNVADRLPKLTTTPAPPTRSAPAQRKGSTPRRGSNGTAAAPSPDWRRRCGRPARPDAGCKRPSRLPRSARPRRPAAPIARAPPQARKTRRRRLALARRTAARSI